MVDIVITDHSNQDTNSVRFHMWGFVFVLHYEIGGGSSEYQVRSGQVKSKVLVLVWWRVVRRSCFNLGISVSSELQREIWR